jgi:trehalose 6-phosphate phosphatase
VGEPLGPALRRLACARVVLVGSDFDGTLARIVPQPEDAAALPVALDALRQLASLERTHVAVISGRSRADLATRASLGDPVRLIGSHGSEDHDGMRLSAEQLAARDRIREAMLVHTAALPGTRVELKPTGAAFHYRHARSDAAQRAVRQLRRHLGTEPVWFVDGKKVLEVGAVPLDKGTALDHLRRAVEADAVLFVGDDETDEQVFARLRSDDIGVKVGEGTSRARYRVADPEAVASLLRDLAILRRSWVDGAVTGEAR